MTTRASFTSVLASLLLTACFVEGEIQADDAGADSSSDDGSGEADAASSTSSVTTTATSVGTSVESASGGSDESGSDGGTETFGESATTTHGSDGSTGEPSTDFALAFDGGSTAISAPYAWAAQDFTVEAWIKIVDADPSGILVDQTDVATSTGWNLQIHPDWNQFAFSFFDAAHTQQIVVGPAIAELAPGWHHVAATKSGGYVLIHVDGVSWDPVPVTTTVATGMIPVSVGDRPAPYEEPLSGIVVDDVRVSNAPRYDADFDRPVVFDEDASTVVLLTFDEGDGSEALDAGGIDFAITSPQWVGGHE